MESRHNPAREPADRLNQECFCITLDRPMLDKKLAARIDDSRDDAPTPKHQHLFSDTPVFVPRAGIARMEQVVQAIESASRLPGYREAVQSWAPDIASFAPGPAGAFMGYDFHLGPDGPRLIEINTNAGGAFINAELGRAQRACCRPAESSGDTARMLDGFEDAVVRMFEREWQRQRSDGRPERIAIVDNDPTNQYLYLEFKLARDVLASRGFEVMILDPAELHYSDDALWAGEKRIDLVYNRLVDFTLGEPRHGALRRAYLEGGVVVTPNPHNHALLADKRNLIVLSDAEALRAWGLDESAVGLLESAIPATALVLPENAEALWQKRRELFFKPVSGHGSKGVYRGGKLTRGVFAQILQGGYIAQAFVAPGERMVRVDDNAVALKVDVRLYTYEAKTLLAAARIYQGQATNFRTPGGGFAPVFQV